MDDKDDFYFNLQRYDNPVQIPLWTIRTAITFPVIASFIQGSDSSMDDKDEGWKMFVKCQIWFRFLYGR